MKIIVVAGAMLYAALLASVVGRAQQPPPVTSDQPRPAPGAGPSLQGYGDNDKSCLAWTDACRTCRRGDSEQIHCSNIGIACQPLAITCTARKDEGAKP